MSQVSAAMLRRQSVLIDSPIRSATRSAELYGGSQFNPASLLTATNGFYFDFTRGATGSGIASMASLPPSTKTISQPTGSSQFNWTIASPSYAFADGVDDSEQSDLNPASSMIIAACCNITAGAAAQVVIGVNGVGSNTRCLLGVNASNQLAGGWGAQGTGTITDGVSAVGVNTVILMRANGSTVELWRNGVRSYSGAASGTTTTVDPLYLGGLNASGGPTINFCNVLIYRAYALQSFGADSQIVPLMRSLGSGIVNF